MQFSIILTYDDGSTAEIIKRSMTSSVGFAVIQFDGVDTQRIKSIDGISASVDSTEFGIAAETVLSVFDLPNVKNPSASSWETLSNFVFDNLPAILLLTVTLGILSMIFIRMVKLIQKQSPMINGTTWS